MRYSQEELKRCSKAAIASNANRTAVPQGLSILTRQPAVSKKK
jgi:hypothetical protein